MIEKREASPTTLLSSTSDIEILNPMLPTEDLTPNLDSKAQNGVSSTNPLAKLAAACTSLCNDMKPKNNSPTYASMRNQVGYATSYNNNNCSNLIRGSAQQFLHPNIVSSLTHSMQGQSAHQLQTPSSIDASYLLAQELISRQNSNSTGLSALDTLAALQNMTSSQPKTSCSAPANANSYNMDYLTKVYLQALVAKKDLGNGYSGSNLDLLNSSLANSDKLLSPVQSVTSPHLHNGVDYRLCPCAGCGTLRLNIFALQQLNKQSAAPSVPDHPQQHYLLPQKNPLTGAVHYIPVCSDPNNCSVCYKTSALAPNNNYVKQTSPTTHGLTAEQYLTMLSATQSQNQISTKSVDAAISPNSKPSQDFSAPLQIQTSPSPIGSHEDITCSWTENGAPCGRRFGSEDQLFEHIKKVHTNSLSVAQQENNPEAEPNPLTSLKNLSRKVLPETPMSHRYHPYARTPSTSDSSRLSSVLTNQNTSRVSSLPLICTSQLPLTALSSMNLPSSASTGALPFSFSTNGTAPMLSANQMSSLLFAAAAR